MARAILQNLEIKAGIKASQLILQNHSGPLAEEKVKLMPVLSPVEGAEQIYWLTQD